MILTGVSAHFCAAHRDPSQTIMHGHTWTVRAWWPAGDDARLLQSRLRAALMRFDHKEIPDELASGEAIASVLAGDLPGAVEIEVSREAEGIFARWAA